MPSCGTCCPESSRCAQGLDLRLSQHLEGAFDVLQMEAPLHHSRLARHSICACSRTNAKLVLLEQLLEATECLELFACQSDVVQDRADVDSLELLAERDELLSVVRANPKEPALQPCLKPSREWITVPERERTMSRVALE